MSHTPRTTLTEIYKDPQFATDPVAIELRGTADLFQDLGYRIPYEATPVDFLYAAGRPFIISETAHVQTLDSLTPKQQRYFGTRVQPELAGRLERRDPKALDLAHQIGRAIGAGGVDGPLIRWEPPVRIDEGSFEVDHKEIPHRMGEDSQPGVVVDLGMGLNGVFAHVKNVKEGRYNVFAVDRGIGEAEVLNGLLAYHDVSDQRIAVAEGGIAQAFDNVLSNGGAGIADMIIASRVHMAGEDLRYGAERSSELLKTAGFLICRGPRKPYASHCIGYDEVATIIENDSSLKIVENYTFAGIASDDSIEPSRLIVAQKI